MIISKKSGIGALLVAGVLLAVIFAPPMSAGMDKTKSEKALEHISQKYGIPKEQLVITNEKEANFSLSNQKIQSVNILDSKGKELYHVDLDEAGNVTDIKAAKTLEYAKYREKYGKKEIELYEKLQKMNPDDTVEVGIWLSPIVDTSQPKSEISKKEYKEMLDAKRLAYEQKEKPVLDILKAKNINIRYASQYAPLIYAQVPVKLIADVENIPEVDGIYLSREFKPALDTIAQTARVQQVWNAGITGSGVKVAVVEKERIDFSNTNLTNGTVYNWSEPGMPHPTWVAGIIASRNNTYQGISYDVPRLLSANYGEGPVSQEESRVIAASEWAINESADILSNSYSNDTGDTGRALAGLDKYFDHIVWEHHKTVIAAAGNNGTGLAYVGTPGLGYNVVTVGGFEDMHDSDWSNDKIWAGSNYKDPISDYGDREKPEVVALATHNGLDTIMSTNSPRFEPDPIGPTNGAGTSWAAPQVAAEAALLMQADSSLKIWPETVKAIIMASAVHNIEGDSRLSEKDGAGGIDISSAYDPRITESSGMIAFTSDFPKHFTFSATAGQKVRVVITWDSHPDSNHPPVNDDLQSDLNLVVYDPSSAVVNISDSFDNSYEIVEFIASTTGTYDATVYARTFSGQYERLGFAKTAIDPSLSGMEFQKTKDHHRLNLRSADKLSDETYGL